MASDHARQEAKSVTAASAGSRYPRTRRISFPFGGDGGTHGKYFVNDDIVFSHFVANLSGAFPSGEELFIRSVRRFSDEVTDPTLKKRVAGFIGQESVHGQQHRLLNEKLIDMGYPIAWWDSKKFNDWVKRLEERLPARLPLAVTAAAEHFTAVLAERTLGEEEIQAIPGELQVWNVLNWHAVEELEHKSVAFDVFRTVAGGTERMRRSVMAVMIPTLLLLIAVTLVYSLAHDPDGRRQPLRVIREAYRLYRGPIFRGLIPDLTKYLRPGFHPDDIDTNALLEHWQEELFGTDGELVGYLK
ncbi:MULTISPECIES: metal-dependent hydrolase [Mycobacterium]|uniref:Metal-dependent hydrolase n=4 Tax=Mycobacterium TaxID=1763 RepID=A0A7I7Z3X9_9MYCO|nr:MULTISPECIES: metal-dependent hydrolase [Mycobacterium]ASL07741.1 metal-dependent hydrolase [Mycobacterium intracellulare subsp. chimaera]ASL13395.1 metal-dependent hydrolase [Mycobacterium intracellulare subsp. chimaera]ASL19530.1 metal-dependent hydrolase [Mycobacterium intracellulare subsp. chimaera]MCA2311859.1 metal-dependent hydrolase [Mycobacterium intracellulare subsp. chimaera]MCA2354417.1 metal-dependent hydrolase [Mycobacterium intracellulare subsp. chimaera]